MGIKCPRIKHPDQVIGIQMSQESSFQKVRNQKSGNQVWTTTRKKAEIKCKEIFESEESLFDLCLITSEDSLLSEDFCQEYCDSLVKSCSERRLDSDAYGWIRRYFLHYWRSIWSSVYHKLDIKPLEYFKKLVDTGKLQPVLDSAYAYEQAEEAFQATATTSNIGKTIVTFGLRGHAEQSNKS